MNGLRKQIIADINKFTVRHGMSLSSFGMSVVKDGKLYSRLCKGKNIGIRTIDRIYEFMENYAKTEDTSSKNSD